MHSEPTDGSKHAAEQFDKSRSFGQERGDGHRKRVQHQSTDGVTSAQIELTDGVKLTKVKDR